MKKIVLIITFNLFLFTNLNAEEISFNCEFKNWTEQKMMSEVIKTKDDLSPDITTDKQITFEKISEDEIFVKKTSFIFPELKNKIKVNVSSDELIFSYGELDTHFEVFILNRLSGELNKNVKRFDEKINILYECKKTNKII